MRHNILKRCIAVVAAAATLAGGGIIANSAFATNGSVVPIPGGGGGGDQAGIVWIYKESWPATLDGVKQAVKETGFKWSESGGTTQKMTDAVKEGVRRCKANYMGSADKAPDCRLVGVGLAVDITTRTFDGNSYWVGSQWNTSFDNETKGNTYYYQGQGYDVDTLFTDREGTKSVKYMERKDVEDTPSALARLIFLAEDQPFNPSFQPTVSTQASPKVIKQGDSISDTVTSGVSGDAKWIDGTNVTAKGYLYYAGTQPANMYKIAVNSGEKPDDYKARVDKTRGSPVATATATFTNSGQSVKVTAKNGSGSVNDTDYKASKAGFYSWMWVIKKNDQGNAKDKVKADFIDPYGETHEHQSVPNHPKHSSTVLERYAGMNQDIMDTLQISNLPDDHGSFDGYDGIPADVQNATISVYWAGSGTGSKEEDLKYEPSTATVPAADAHHKLIGSWDVPAVNGEIRIGGGKIIQNGKTIKEDEKLKIRATSATQTGYYIFVWSFAGDGRVEPFTSAYNDPWEYSFVEQSGTPKYTLSTDVNKREAARGEKFHDTITLSGDLAEGDWVEVKAYKPTDNGPDASLPTILNQNITITKEQAEQAASSQVTLTSQDVSTTDSGKVYWQATLYRNIDGKATALASHPLGIETETTVIPGNNISTTTSKDTTYTGQPVHDTATVSGPVNANSYVTFTAYDSVDGAPNLQGKKLLDNQKVTLTAQQVADLNNGKTVSVDSQDVKPTKPGKVYWQATLYDASNLKLATHDLGIASETVEVRNPELTTTVSDYEVKSDEKFSDSATITGALENGDYVTFDAYQPQDTETPNAQAQKLYEKRVNIPADKIAASLKGENTVVNSGDTSTNKYGYVFWQATLHKKDGTVKATHDLGAAGETVHVVPPTITTQVNQSEVGIGEKFHDTAVIDGQVQEGDYVIFEAYKPVAGQPNTTVGTITPKGGEKVSITADLAAKSKNNVITVRSKDYSTLDNGKVYWKASLYDKTDVLLNTHDLGIASETVVVKPPSITTQVSKEKVKPGEEFYDTATITGKVLEGSYVEFTAYDSVVGDPDTNAAKLLDRQKVLISKALADQSATKKISVDSNKVKTSNAGTVYWQAVLYNPQGVELDRHRLGLPSESVQINPGGIVSSEAQKMGAAGEQLYDEITVYDETDASESADGVIHEGEGNSNEHGSIGRIPQNSKVRVTMYRQSDEDEGQGLYKIASKDFTLDVNKFTPIKSGQKDKRPGKYTFKATDPSFKTDKAGQVWWEVALLTPQGGVLDQHKYGEMGDSHETGYASHERTPVQKYSTNVSKKWLSDNANTYEDKTLQVYDVLHQTAYEKLNADYTKGHTAQTTDGTKVQYEVWKRNGGNGDVKVKTFDAKDLPKVRELARNEDVDKNHRSYGSDDLDNYQNVKSGTFSIPADWTVGKYYFRVKITAPTTTAGTGSDTEDRNRDVVWYGGYDENEAFDLIHVETKSTEPLWLNTMNVSDQITLKGNIPAGTQYEAELWRTSKDGNVRKDAASKQDDSDHNGIASEKVATTGRVDVPASAIGSHLNGVTFRSKSVKNPGVGSYIWRVKVYTPEMPHKDGNGVGTGGDTSMNPAFGVITKEWMTAAKATTQADDNNAGDYWQPATKTQKGNGDGYADRWLIFDGKNNAAEKFEVVKLTTTVAGTNGMHTSKGEHYVDATKGADVNDHLNISGYMLKGYKVAFNLFKQAQGQSADKDTQIAHLDAVELSEAQKALDSARTHITDPADYYWQWEFTKPDGTAFQPDNITIAKSDKRIADESFHAVRITTDTYKWSAKNGKQADTMRVEGHLPSDATATFEIHDYNTHEKVASTKPATLKSLGYDETKYDQRVTGPTLTVPDAKDYYWVEIVNLPQDDQSTPLHTGDANVPEESFRSVEAVTDVPVERYKGSTVKDHADFTNIKWKKQGEKDIRQDLYTGLQARWFLYKQGNGGVDTDKKVFTGDYENLTSGQTEAYGPSKTINEVGDYYWQIEISDPSNNHRVIKLGTQRDPRESFRIISAKSESEVEQQVNKPTSDKVTITGHPAEGTLVTWQLYKRNNADEDNYLSVQSEDSDASVATRDKLVASFDKPENGAHLITAAEAKAALKDGKVTVTGPSYTPTEVGEYWWQFSLTSPTKNLAGDGQPNKPKNNKDTSHLESTVFFTDLAHEADETVQIVDAYTKVRSLSHIGDKFHDTIWFEGRIAEGTQADATLYRQADGEDQSKDEKILTTDRIVLHEGQTFADLPDVTVDKVGTYYWQEHVYAPTKHTDGKTACTILSKKDDGKTDVSDKNDESKKDDSDNTEKCEEIPVEDKEFITGAPRLGNETISIVKVTTKADKVDGVKTPLKDKAIIEGDVPEGSYIIFTLWKQDKGNDPTADQRVWVSDKVMLSKGQKEAYSPEHKVDETGTYYWRESIYPPTGDEDKDVPPCVPGNENGEEVCKPNTDTPSSSDKNDNCGSDSNSGKDDGKTDCTVPSDDDKCDTPNKTGDEDCIKPSHTEKPRTPDESTEVVKVTTQADPEGTATKPTKDTAAIEGNIPDDDYQLVFELWEQNGGDVSSDKLVATTDAVAVKPHATKVEGPGVKPDHAGTYYWRERLIEKSTNRLVHYGDARVKEETVVVRELANTGVSFNPVIPIVATAVVLAAAGVTFAGRKRHSRAW